MSDISENVKSEQQWLRGLFMLLYLIAYEVAKVILILLTLCQFLFSILSGKPNANLQQFGDSLGQYAAQMVAFLSYNSDEKPFPFAEWPLARSRTSAQDDEDESPPTTGS